MPMYMLMADRPIATAPERSMAAFSTRTTRRPRPRAQLAASKAAPQPAMPPPTMRTSHSTVSTAGSNGISRFLRGSGVDGGQGVDVQVLRLTHQVLGGEALRRRVRLAAGRVDRAPGRRPDRVLEPLDLTVAVLDGPHDRVGAPEGGDPRAHRHHVGVAPHL